jgi:hypothetical protein
MDGKNKVWVAAECAARDLVEAGEQLRAEVFLISIRRALSKIDGWVCECGWVTEWPDPEGRCRTCQLKEQVRRDTNKMIELWRNESHADELQGGLTWK